MAVGAVATALVAGSAIAANVIPKLVLPEEFAEAAVPPGHEGAYRTTPMWNVDVLELEYAPSSELVAALRGKGDAELGTPVATTLSIVGGAITPAVSVVRTGGTLSIVNKSAYRHHPRALSPAFDFGMLVTGAPSEELELTDAGVVEIRDRNWPHVRARVVVVDGALFSEVAPDGTARFEAVPPGSYQLEVYFRGYLIREEAIEVPDSPRDLRLDVGLEPFVPPEPVEPPESAAGAETGTGEPGTGEGAADEAAEDEAGDTGEGD